MFAVVFALAFGVASAFVAPQASQPAAAIAATKEDMMALAEANPDFLGKSIGFW